MATSTPLDGGPSGSTSRGSTSSRQRSKHTSTTFIVDIIEATSAANGAHHYRHLWVYFGWLVKRKEIKTGNPMDETDPPNVPEKVTPLLSDEDHEAVLLACCGKENKVRWVRFGASTGLALARYVKARVSHPLADSSPAMWLSRRTDKPLGVDGIKTILNRRVSKPG